MNPSAETKAPFRRVLVAYDGSEPAERALDYGIALGRAGAALDVVHFVDETPVFAQSATTVGVFDPTPILEALDRQGKALLEGARARALTAGVDVTTSLVHGPPIVGIGTVAARNHDELIVLGTHARSGLPRTFLGSTTEGVLRGGTVPVLAITAAMAPPATPIFRKLLVAVDESDPADAAVRLAARVARGLGTQCVLAHVVDTRDLYDKAATYGYDPSEMAEQMRAQARDGLERARLHGGFAAGSTTTTIAEDAPAEGIIAEAERARAEAIVIGSHGRRGLRRLFLGSVAEKVVRHSPVPVLVVRELPAPNP